MTQRLELAPGTDPAALRQAAEALTRRHAALRTRMRFTDGSWRQDVLAEAPDGLFSRYDVSRLDATEREAEVQEAADQAQAGLDPVEGRMIRVLFFDSGAQQPGQLVITIHHLAVDGVSWRILLADFEAAYQGIELPAADTPYGRWAARLEQHTSLRRAGLRRRVLDAHRRSSGRPARRQARRQHLCGRGHRHRRPGRADH